MSANGTGFIVWKLLRETLPEASKLKHHTFTPNTATPSLSSDFEGLHEIVRTSQFKLQVQTFIPEKCVESLESLWVSS